MYSVCVSEMARGTHTNSLDYTSCHRISLLQTKSLTQLTLENKSRKSETSEQTCMRLEREEHFHRTLTSLPVAPPCPILRGEVHACEVPPPVRAVSGRGNSATPWTWDAGSRKSEQLELETLPSAKKQGQ